MRGEKSKPIVAIDAMALAWGVRKDPTATAEQLMRAEWLFDMLDEIEAQIIVPTVVLSEYLVPIDPSKRQASIAEASQRFLIAPFDVRATALAAELFLKGKAMRGIGATPGVPGIPGERNLLKNDTIVIATACTAGASVLYTHDGQCRELARHCMAAEDFPTGPNNLFAYTIP